MDIIIKGNREIMYKIKKMPDCLNDELDQQTAAELMNGLIEEAGVEKERSEDIIFDTGCQKCSVFNYITSTESGNIIYNTLYNSLVRLDDAELEYYNGNKEYDDNLTRQFFENGLWVDEKTDELNNLLRYCYYLVKYQEHEPQITVTTTMKCNARCFYCYEKGTAHRDMPKKTEDEIVKFIQTLDTSKDIKINWFGGEPFMNTECIDNISQKLKDLNISFSSFIISNGSLITDEIIEKMKDLWNTKQIQITIDGTEVVYRKRKNYSDNNGDYFDLLWKIRKVSRNGIYVQIRMNIDENNEDDVCYLVDELEGFFGKISNITYYPAFLDGVGSKLTDEERVDILLRIFESVEDKSKLTINDKLYSLPKVSPCMIYDKHSYTVDVNGDVFRCEHQVGNAAYAIGKIGSLSSESAKVNIQTLRDECRKCVFLPKCMGGCTSNHENGDNPCMIIRYMIEAYLKLL